MNPYRVTRAEEELKQFISRNFERPGNCRNLEQIRFYIRELCVKIEEMETRFSYVPDWAYSLLAQYNVKQNSLLHVAFRSTYF